MIRTVRDSVEYLLQYLSPEERAIPATKEENSTGDLVESYPGRISAAVQAINGAIQEVFSLGSLHQARRPFGAIINAPLTSTFDVEAGGEFIRFPSSGWKSWMIGCTCKIDGDSADNQILDYSLVTGTLTLARPYVGTESGEKSVTVWHDSFEPDTMAGELLSLSLAKEGALSPVDSPDFLANQIREEQDFGFRSSSSRGSYFAAGSLSNFVGVPRQYFVDTLHRPTAKPERRIRIFPLPVKQFVLNYRARVVPPQFEESAVHLAIPTSITGDGLAPSPTVTLAWDSTAQLYKSAPATFEIKGVDGFWKYTVENSDYDTPITPGPRYEDGPVGTYAHKYKVGGVNYAFPFTVVNAVEVAPTAQPKVALPIHNEWIESIFLPIAAQRFQVSPFFRNDSATDEIKRQYQAALDILKTSAPQTKQSLWLKPIYG